MTPSDIANIRLYNQQIAQTKFKTAKEIVSWMGAMQAQDFAMAKWAVGVRLTGSTEKQVQAAIDKGEIIRTHLLRPTWHFVSADDIYWLLDLSSPRLKASMKSRHKQLGLSDDVFKKCNKLFANAFKSGRHLTREELMAIIEKAKIKTNEYRGLHIMMQAELDGLICSGTTKDKKQTYALLEERVPKRKSLDRGEALAKLAERYFTSHGPATVKDFAWWSGLSASDARNAVEMVKSKFISATVNGQIYWLPDSSSFTKSKKTLIHLLPAYDEFIISYTDRSPSLHHAEHRRKAVSNNGIFRPVIVQNGQVVGLWKRMFGKESLSVQADFFELPDKLIESKVLKAVEAFGKFQSSKAKFLK